MRSDITKPGLGLDAESMARTWERVRAEADKFGGLEALLADAARNMEAYANCPDVLPDVLFDDDLPSVEPNA
jgi:hypothetical protein